MLEKVLSSLKARRQGFPDGFLDHPRASKSYHCSRLGDLDVAQHGEGSRNSTGGVSASFAMLGDIQIAEPGAVIGFAGARVIEETIRETLPPGFQRAEYLLEHGMLDMVVPRSELRETIGRLLSLLMDTPSVKEMSSALPEEAPERASEEGSGEVEAEEKEAESVGDT